MTTTYHSFLPVELITRIFVLGANFDYPYTDSPFLFKPVQNTFYNSPPQDFQITVSQICRGWRTIALRTSCLWSTLHFHEPLHINRARVFLSRCRPESATTFDILISTVAQREHIPNVTLYLEELHTIFQLLVPHVQRWRAFHLKIRNNDCKLVAHFDSSADLYIATYRRPVTIFSNDLPRIKNVSLIGVNLPWDESPYLHRLESLELALHLDNVRPSYIYWDNMLRGSPSLRRLLLHYSGPRISDGTQANAWPSSVTWPSERTTTPIVLDTLVELSLVDLDSDYLCRAFEGVVFPGVTKLTMGLSEAEQSYSNVVGMLIGVRTNSSRAVSVHKPLPNLHLLVDLTITALECSLSSFSDLIRSLVGVQRLDIDFSRVCGGEGWKVFIAASEGDDDQASVAMVEDDANSADEDSEGEGSYRRRTHRTPTPPYAAGTSDAKGEKETDLEWQLPEGPVPRPLSSRSNSVVTSRSGGGSTSGIFLRKQSVRGILPRLEVFRLRELEGERIQSIISAWITGYGLDSREWWLFCRADVGAVEIEWIGDDDEDAEDEDEGEDDDEVYYNSV
ncbi:hypothetical protein BDZ89DRAFT_1138265 [Hymenopellis radicata]|nr:hypothetical protein BDZ89DRAFT_1138265 [Hymenopellis radicata]